MLHESSGYGFVGSQVLQDRGEGLIQFIVVTDFAGNVVWHARATCCRIIIIIIIKINSVDFSHMKMRGSPSQRYSYLVVVLLRVAFLNDCVRLRKPLVFYGPLKSWRVFD